MRSQCLSVDRPRCSHCAVGAHETVSSPASQVHCRPRPLPRPCHPHLHQQQISLSSLTPTSASSLPAAHRPTTRSMTAVPSSRPSALLVRILVLSPTILPPPHPPLQAHNLPRCSVSRFFPAVAGSFTTPSAHFPPDAAICSCTRFPVYAQRRADGVPGSSLPGLHPRPRVTATGLLGLRV